jgi:hypothetical protein
MDLERARRAAHNNARWCDAVCRAHGGDTAFGVAAWFNRRPSPPHYPNLVTLDPHAYGAPALAAIPPHGELGVKDSFARFDLSDLGFAPLFDAQWIWREPQPAARSLASLQWSVADDDETLAAWEAAWRRSVREGPSRLRLFPPALLAEPGLRFLIGRGPDGTIDAGGALMQRDGVAGLACTYLPQGDRGREAYAELLQAAQSACPDCALVGYESGEELRLAEEAGGFTPVGPLRVWLRRPG